MDGMVKAEGNATRHRLCGAITLHLVRTASENSCYATLDCSSQSETTEIYSHSAGGAGSWLSTSTLSIYESVYSICERETSRVQTELISWRHCYGRQS
jgi:hypothetical protein